MKFSTRGSLQGNCDIQRFPKWNPCSPLRNTEFLSIFAGRATVICLEKSDLRDFFFLSQLDLIAMTVVSTVVSYSWDVDRLSKWEEGIAAWVESLSLEGKHPFSMTSTQPSCILSPPFFFAVQARWNKGKQEAGPLQRNGSPACSSCSARIAQSNEPLLGTNPNVNQRAYSPVLRARPTYCSALKITWGKQGNSELGKRMIIY